MEVSTTQDFLRKNKQYKKSIDNLLICNNWTLVILYLCNWRKHPATQKADKQWLENGLFKTNDFLVNYRATYLKSSGALPKLSSV